MKTLKPFVFTAVVIVLYATVFNLTQPAMVDLSQFSVLWRPAVALMYQSQDVAVSTIAGFITFSLMSGLVTETWRMELVQEGDVLTLAAAEEPIVFFQPVAEVAAAPVVAPQATEFEQAVSDMFTPQEWANLDETVEQQIQELELNPTTQPASGLTDADWDEIERQAEAATAERIREGVHPASLPLTEPTIAAEAEELEPEMATSDPNPIETTFTWKFDRKGKGRKQSDIELVCVESGFRVGLLDALAAAAIDKQRLYQRFETTPTKLVEVIINHQFKSESGDAVEALQALFA